MELRMAGFREIFTLYPMLSLLFHNLTVDSEKLNDDLTDGR